MNSNIYSESSPKKQSVLELSVEEWLNCDSDLSFSDLSGRVIVLEVFQMLCPACVTHGLPQVQRIRESFPSEELMVVGLHSVFEHHEAMNVLALKAFLSEYNIQFPVGIDRPSDGHVPEPMKQFQLRGTPSLLLFDKQGRLRANHFGMIPDLQIVAEIGKLLLEE